MTYITGRSLYTMNHIPGILPKLATQALIAISPLRRWPTRRYFHRVPKDLYAKCCCDVCPKAPATAAFVAAPIHVINVGATRFALRNEDPAVAGAMVDANNAHCRRHQSCPDRKSPFRASEKSEFGIEP
jgi:hypothetical protein